MRIQGISIFALLTLLSLSSAFARSPAVEDFVGVEPEGSSRSPQGTEVLFEFGNTVRSFESQSSSNWNSPNWSLWTPTLVLVSFILLPFVMWFGVTRSANNVEKTIMRESKNVAHLSDYKSELEPEHKKEETSEKEEDFKQAS